MEILIGAVITLLTELVKKVTSKFGKEIGGAIILVSAFIISVVYTLGVDLSDGFIDINNIDYETIVGVFGASVAVYEVAVKRIITPTLAKATKKK